MLKITKKGDKYWLFEDSEIGLFSPSKFTINLLNNVITIVYENGLKSKNYNVIDCEIYDLGATSPFTTSSGNAFMEELENLNCPCFQKNENIFNISGGAWGDITGNLSNQTDLQSALDSKLNKDTTAGVERAYIINADGSQGTKATNDFKDVLEFANLASFPVTGETGIIYVALDTNKTYRWSGSAYVQIGGGGTSESDLYSYWFSYTASYQNNVILYTNTPTTVLTSNGTLTLVPRTGTTLYNSYHFFNFLSATTAGSNAGTKMNNSAEGHYRQGIEAYFIFGNNDTNTNHVTAVGSYSLLSNIPNLDIANFTTDFVGVGNDPTDTNLSFYCKRIDATASYLKIPTNSNFPAHTVGSDIYMLKFESNKVLNQLDFQIKLTLTNLINGAEISHTFTGLECPDLNKAFVNCVNRSNRNTGVAASIRWIKTYVKQLIF